jgi:hypothetical protein
MVFQSAENGIDRRVSVFGKVIQSTIFIDPLT